MPSNTSLIAVFVALVKQQRLRFGTLDDSGDPLSFREDAAQRERLLQILEAHDGLVMEITIRPRPRRRTQQQSRYERGALKIICDHLGWDKHQQDALHRDLLRECFGDAVDVETGELLPVVTSSRDLSTDAFREFLEWIPRVALERYGVHVPTPGEMDYRPTVTPTTDDHDHSYTRS